MAYDAFEWIYGCFLGEFASTDSKGGDFYTPGNIAHLIVEILEPYRCRVLDLEGDVRHGGQVNSYYDATVRFEFLHANPPFNVNAVESNG